jgi:hypothetical protein
MTQQAAATKAKVEIIYKDGESEVRRFTSTDDALDFLAHLEDAYQATKDDAEGIASFQIL